MDTWGFGRATTVCGSDTTHTATRNPKKSFNISQVAASKTTHSVQLTWLWVPTPLDVCIIHTAVCINTPKLLGLLIHINLDLSKY